MEQEQRRDLAISGIMGGSGGIYNNVTINGRGTIRGPLDCIGFQCSGTADIRGDVKTQSMQINGLAKVAGKAGVGRLRVEGKLTVADRLGGEDIDVHGFLNVNGHCDAESFRASGGFRIGGLLNAGTFDIELFAPCGAKEIGGGTIRVCKPVHLYSFAKLLKSLLPKFDVLKADAIEGDDIHLEHTRAKVVRGTNVTIGPGCEIDLVEYKEALDLDKDAIVREQKQV